MYYELIEQISKDLGVVRSKGENNKNFHARVLYSAISYWIRINMLSTEIKVTDTTLVGISKLKNTLDVKRIIKDYFELFPHVREWFKNMELDEVVNKIRYRLEDVGEVISFDNRIALSDKKSKIYHNKFNRSSIIQDDFTEGYVSGLTWFHNYDCFDGIEFEHYINLSPEKFAQSMIKNVVMKPIQDISNFEYFSPDGYRQFHNSWEEINNEVSDNRIYLARKKNHIGFDFFWYQRVMGKDYISRIQEIYVEDFEISRLLYGLNEIAGYRNTITIFSENKTNTCSLNIKNGIPNFEKQILNAICWPINSIDDSYNYVFNSRIYPLICSLLNRLNIIIEKEG